MAQGQKLTLVSTPEEIKSWTELKTVPNKFSYFPVKFQANGTAQSLLGSLEEKMGHTGTMIIGAAIPREISIGFVKMVRKTGSRMKIFL